MRKFNRSSAGRPWLARAWRSNIWKQERLPEDRGAFLNLIPAATYVPTQLPAQYHRPSEA